MNRIGQRLPAALGFGSPAETRDPCSGFSLIEVIVVVAVIAILAAVALPVVDLTQNRARGEATRQGMEALGDALDSYFIDHLAFPATLADLETAGYITGGFAPGAAFRDAWGTDYVYEPAATAVQVRSLGPDQTEAAPNLQLAVDGIRHLQDRTRVDLETIHLGLRNYESRRMSDSLQVLPAVWFDAADPVNCAFGVLVQKGYLLNSTRYTRDSWGSPYVYRGSPADYVKSSNLVETGKALSAPSGPRRGVSVSTCCGMEVSSDTLKYVVLGDGRRGRHLVGYGRVALEKGSDVGEVLRRLRAEGKIPLTHLRVALGTQASILRVLSLPPMPARDLARVVQGEVSKELQILTEEMSSGYQVLPRPRGSDRRPVLVALTPRAGLQAFERAMQPLGFQVDILTTTSLGLLGYVRGLRDLSEGEEAVAVLHLGSDRMVLAVTQGCVFRQFRDLGVGLDASLLERPEATGTDGAEVDWDALDQIGRGLDEISQVAAQISRTLEVDARTHEGLQVRRLFLAGDVTRGEAMAPILQNEVGLPVQVLDPLAGLALDRDEPEFVREAASYALPLALARARRSGTILHLGSPPAPTPPIAFWAAATALAVAGLIVGTVASSLEGRGYLRGLQRADLSSALERDNAGEQAGLGAWARDAGVGPRAPLEWIGRSLPAQIRANRVDLARRAADWGVRLDGAVVESRAEGRLSAWSALADSLGHGPAITEVNLQPVTGERPSRREETPVSAGFRFRVRP